MIAVLVFYLHIAGVSFVFAKNYHEHKFVDAILAVAFVAIIFSVGWTIAGFVVQFVVPPEGFGTFLDSDSISLLIVTLLETLLYGIYFLRKDKQPKVAEE